MRVLVGTFAYAGSSERGRIMIDRAIELATEDMGFLRESIASDRLEEKTAIAEHSNFKRPFPFECQAT